MEMSSWGHARVEWAPCGGSRGWLLCCAKMWSSWTLCPGESRGQRRAWGRGPVLEKLWDQGAVVPQQPQSGSHGCGSPDLRGVLRSVPCHLAIPTQSAPAVAVMRRGAGSRKGGPNRQTLAHLQCFDLCTGTDGGGQWLGAAHLEQDKDEEQHGMAQNSLGRPSQRLVLF